jgi:hypothetical protein
MLKIKYVTAIKMLSILPRNEEAELHPESVDCHLISGNGEKYFKIRIIQSWQSNPSKIPSKDKDKLINAYEAFLEI